MSRTRIALDRSMGKQPHFDITEVSSLGGMPSRYTVEVAKPNGAPMFAPLVVESWLDMNSIAHVTAQAMAKEETLCYGYNNKPYLWADNHWVNAEQWLSTVSQSMNMVVRTGSMSNRSGRSFYAATQAAWAATGKPFLALKPFGECKGIPVRDKVIVIRSDGKLDFADHEPGNQNLCVLPINAQDVCDEYVELYLGARDDSQLVRFLKSSLDKDQLVAIRRWFGLHLVLHRIGNPDKMLFMYGPGGNGKSVIIGLLRALLTDDSVAALRLVDLKVSANVERLVGKLAMIGSEGSPETDNELLKAIVSHEGINVNPKYRDPFELVPQCLVTQASNPAPRFSDDTDAMVRRVIAIEMTYQPEANDKVIAIASRIKDEEYALLVAFALHGAGEVIEAGTIEVPESIREFSARVVRPVRAVDRFVELLEFGDYEVADDELYRAFTLTCQRQRLTLQPVDEFFSDLVKRLKRAVRPFERRSKVSGYKPSVHITDRSERALLVPQLDGAEHLKVFFGLRIAAGPFGPPIGNESVNRRGLQKFDATKAPLAHSAVD